MLFLLLCFQMRRIVILGRGGAGKSTLATQIGDILQLPVIELDKYFWKPGLTPTPKREWINVQQELASKSGWVMDGDLGKYDVLEARLQAADTVIILDFSLMVCLIRALRRSKERADFWWWLITWRLSSRPKILATISSLENGPKLVILKTPSALERFVAGF